MTFPEITALLTAQFGDAIQANTTNLQPYLTIPTGQLTAICQFLRDHDRLFFDLLACITAIDNGPEASTMEVIYNFTSIPYAHDLMMKVTVPRSRPEVPSVAHIWRTADWHERESYDLVGVLFSGHPDLRRILLPTDWNGHPLRRDYQEEEQYHGIKTK